MRLIKTKIFEGKNIYSYRTCIRMDIDLEGYCEIPSKEIEDFNFNLVNMIPELKTHRCGIDEDEGFIKRLKEGTYLAHICEHIIIAIQNKIGIEVVYGKSREIKDNIYYIIFEYIYANTALETSRLAIDIINALINKQTIDYDRRIELLNTILKEEYIGPTTEAICNAAKRKNIPVMKLGQSDFYQLGYGKQGRIIEAAIGCKTSCIAVDMASDKLLTKELLKIQNLPVAQGAKVYNVIDLLREGEYIGYPLVLKPQFGNQGKGIILNINNEKELINAYEALKGKFKDLIIEKYYGGNDYRVCVIDYKVTAASLRTPPYLIGDGKSTISELINILNENPVRGDGHEKSLTRVKIDIELIECLKNINYNQRSILKKDEKIFLRRNANLSTGGSATDCTDIICDENREICIRAAKTLGLDICGIDICTEDISKPLYNNGIIMEVNAAPGLRMHLNPSHGEKKAVGDDIVNMLYEGNPKNIPVISVTGTNGKTTTTRIISHTLSKMGYITGMTSTQGIYINGKCIDKGDDTGVESAKSVLLNRDVDIAVLETARGGIIKRGLAYDVADVAVITNITEDHLGVDGVETMEELCFVKALVAEAVKPTGYVVINAEDKWSKSIIKRISANKIYFAKSKENELIKKNIDEGKIAIYIENDWITVTNNGKIFKVSKIDMIPITLNGKLTFNVENILAVCGALVGLQVDYCMIKKGIESFFIDSQENLGRFNCYMANGVNIILDYGHNIEGYRAVLSSIKSMKHGKIHGVVGIPGDRGNEVAIKIGSICSQFLDNIIIKEDKDKRGRDIGEVSKLIQQGVKSSHKKMQSKIILDEIDAFKRAMIEAKVGDTIIVFFEEIEPLIEIIKNDYSNNIENSIMISSL